MVICLSGVTEVRQETPGLQDSSFGQNASNSSLCQNASNSERSLNVKPTNQSSASVDGRESEPLQGNDSVSGASSQDQIKDPGSESGRDTSASLVRRLLAFTFSLSRVFVCQVLPRIVKKRPNFRTLRLARTLSILSTLSDR